jgi:hypothetical protein
MPDLHPSIVHVPMPDRIKHLPVDGRGFPVPWFVAIINDVPDHRVVEAPKFGPALREKRCWICGTTLGKHLAFLLGPMCVVTRTVSEPPAHRDCAEYALQACPFLTRPYARRREGGLPEEGTWTEGGLKRNPGATALWMTRRFKPWQGPDGSILFTVGDPAEVTWWAEGRAATRAEVLHSLETGLPVLLEAAEVNGETAKRELALRLQRAMQYLPKEVAA